MSSEAKNWICPRAGLGSVWSALKQSKCVIGYIGASILAQVNGYRPKLHEWLCRESGNEHRAVNAGFGANGSLCSVFVMDKLVLAHLPVLCFVDLSVADLAPFTPLAEVGPVMEGIVRKLLAQGTQVCFLHMYRADRHYLEEEEVVRIHEMVAAYYQIPSLNLGLELEQQFRNGTLTHDEIFRDALHPHPDGAAKITELLAEALSSVMAVGPAARALPEERLFLRSYEHTNIVECTDEMFWQGKSSGNGMFRLFYPYKTVSPDNPITFTAADGEVVGILAIVGRDSGIISVVSNGGVSKDYLLWDSWCSADRVQAVIFESFVEPGTEFSIVATNKEFDSAGCDWMQDAPSAKSLRLVGFLVRKDYDH